MIIGPKVTFGLLPCANRVEQDFRASAIATISNDIVKATKCPGSSGEVIQADCT